VLDKMRQLALAHLCAEAGAADMPDPEVLYKELRSERLGWLFRFLVEDVAEDDAAEAKAHYYTLEADRKDDSAAVLSPHDLTREAAAKLPFNKPSGPNSPALGPVIKRMPPSRSNKEGAPKLTTQQRTLERFKEIAQEGRPWSAYFRQALSCWTRKNLNVDGQVIEAKKNAYQEAVDRISEKRTVLLAYRTADGKLPGEVPEYVAYLQETLARSKYEVKDNGPRPGHCALCGTETTVYPNALKGAGLNIANLDRDGAFPGLNPDRAVATFGVCVPCADLLYVYCRHVAPGFVAAVAGERALIVPALSPDPGTHAPFMRKVGDWLRQAAGGKGLRSTERQLLKTIGQEKQAVATIDIVWANFGQVIDGVRGLVTDVLPSRLQEIAAVNEQVEKAPSSLFPEERLDEFAYDLSLSILHPLLKRPGGKAAQRSNESRRLWELRRGLAEAIYHRRELPEERFEAEVLATARWHWDEASQSDSAVYLLTREGYSEKKKTAFLTVAGWVKQLYHRRRRTD
jgi:CRISPR-associated protein Csh1